MGRHVDPLLENVLTPAAREALQRAKDKPLSYGVRAYRAPAGEGEPPRVLVALGEAHLKLGEASDIGAAVVREFELRGVETFQINDVFLGRTLAFLIKAPRVALRGASLGNVKDSTITLAKELTHGTTVELERTSEVPLALHAASAYLSAFFTAGFTSIAAGAARRIFPKSRSIDMIAKGSTVLLSALELHTLAALPALELKDKPWAFLVHPAVGLISARDTLMAEGTIKMMREHPEVSAAVVVMGRAHLPGFERELIEKHGFRKLEV